VSELDQLENGVALESLTADAAELLRPLMREPVKRVDPPAVSGLLIGKLLALIDDGRTALVHFVAPSIRGGLRARSVVDLRDYHVGQDVVIGFELEDRARPVVLGVLQGQPSWPLPQAPGQVTVDADGERMVVSAQVELVLRCGKSSISLRSDGHVEIRGETVVTHATAANRIRGGSVELN
jgi:hypothetical protein